LYFFGRSVGSRNIINFVKPAVRLGIKASVVKS